MEDKVKAKRQHQGGGEEVEIASFACYLFRFGNSLCAYLYFYLKSAERAAPCCDLRWSSRSRKRYTMQQTRNPAFTFLLQYSLLFVLLLCVFQLSLFLFFFLGASALPILLLLLLPSFPLVS